MKETDSRISVCGRRKSEKLQNQEAQKAEYRQRKFINTENLPTRNLKTHLESTSQEREKQGTDKEVNENQKHFSAKIPFCQEERPLFAGIMKPLHSTMLNYPRKRNSHEGPERRMRGYAHLVSQHNHFLASTNVPFFDCCSTEWNQRNPNNHNQYRWRFADCQFHGSLLEIQDQVWTAIWTFVNSFTVKSLTLSSLIKDFILPRIPRSTPM